MTAVEIIDVSPRDGLQIDSRIASVDEKVILVERLAQSGLRRIEVTSFVHPKFVPQMADATEVLARVTQIPNLQTIALVPNLKGYERARQTEVSEVNWVSAATETFNAKNIGQTKDENFHQFQQMLRLAKEDGKRTAFSIAVSFGCPYEGETDPQAVLDLAERVLATDVDRLMIADTIGIAIPTQIEALMPELVEMTEKAGKELSLHLHDTRGFGIANAYEAYRIGVRSFEASASGIGGCPFAPGAAGNIATEDLAYLFERMQVDTKLQMDRLIEAANVAASLSTKTPLGKIRPIYNQEKGNDQ